MYQQINFYQLLPQPSKSWFSWKMLYYIYGLFILLLFVKFIFALWHKHELTIQLRQETILLAQAQQNFSHLIAKYPSIDIKNLQNVGENLRTQLGNQSKIIYLLAQSAKFTAYLKGLAEATIPGAWLTEIIFSSTDPYIVLKGNALQPLMAQQFLDHLVQQTVFVTQPLKLNDLTQVNLNKQQIVNFNITTKVNPPK